MLLRLLPVPTPSQPSPPTILFTLPLPNHAYTAKSLPLPANLLTHRALCIQEDLDIPNVLLGEKSSWICGIIEDVTFSLVQSHVNIHLIDGTIVTLPLTERCHVQLNRVVEEVQLSFAAAAAPPPAPPAEPRTSTSSAHSVSSVSSSTSASSVVSQLGSTVRRSSPSSLLFSLLSPLLPQQSAPTVPPHVAAQQQPARAHRRQARSLLVDAYRRYILPELKSQLPSSYLPWVIQGEASRKLTEFDRLKEEILSLLSVAGVEQPSVPVASGSSHRRSKSQSSSDNSSSESESDEDHEFSPSSPETTATSIMSSEGCDSSTHKSSSGNSITSFLATIPPSHAIPIRYRPTYVAQVKRMTALSERLHSIRHLGVRYEREEGKRRWLEGLELGRLADRSQRRAFSCGLLRPTRLINSEPVKRSHLYQSWSVEDEARVAREREAAKLHPAMMESVTEVVSSSDGEDDDACSVTSSSSSDISSASSSPVPTTPTCEQPPSPTMDVMVREEDEMNGVSATFIRVFHPQTPDQLGLVLETPTPKSKLRSSADAMDIDEVADENTRPNPGLGFDPAPSPRSRITASLSLAAAEADAEVAISKMQMDGTTSPTRPPHVRLPRWDATTNAPATAVF